MPFPLIIWAGIALSGVVATGWTADQIGDAVTDSNDSAANLTKWVVTGGALYVSYRALQAAGAIK